MAYKFQVGQTVQMVQGRRYLAISAVDFEVVRQLPEILGERSYRIKSLRESFERVAIESQLIRG
jgi:hypothetical protein